MAELERMGLTEDGLLAARREPASLAGYLELHIEQGPVLERAGVDVGVVTGIIGSASFNVVFEGDARHAGTTPMDARRDAALGASAFVLGVRDTVVTGFPGCVATVGTSRRSPARTTSSPGGRGSAWSAARSQRRAGRTRAGAHSPRARRGGALRPRRHRDPARALGARPDGRADPGCARARCRGARAQLDADALRGGTRRTGARRDHAERDGVRPLRRRRQPRPLRAHALGGLRQRRQRAAQRDRRARPRGRPTTLRASDRGSTSCCRSAQPGRASCHVSISRRSSASAPVGSASGPAGRGRARGRAGPGCGRSGGRRRGGSRAPAAGRAGSPRTRGRARPRTARRGIRAPAGRARASPPPAPPSSRGRGRAGRDGRRPSAGSAFPP